MHRNFIRLPCLGVEPNVASIASKALHIYSQGLTTAFSLHPLNTHVQRCAAVVVNFIHPSRVPEVAYVGGCLLTIARSCIEAFFSTQKGGRKKVVPSAALTSQPWLEIERESRARSTILQQHTLTHLINLSLLFITQNGQVGLNDQSLPTFIMHFYPCVCATKEVFFFLLASL